jgi:hypothetical protein
LSPDRSTPSIDPSKGTTVSNPVAPPPSSEGEVPPPPANQGFGDAPAPGSPVPGQPVPGQPVPGQPVPGQPGFPPPPAHEGFGDAPAGTGPAPEKKSGVGKILLRIAGVVVVGLIVFGVKSFFFSATDKAKDAAVGDCIASSKQVTGTESTEAEAKVVDCASSEAKFSVVGRVNGETDVKSKSCDKFFKENDEFFVYAADNGATGYLLCLKPKA